MRLLHHPGGLARLSRRSIKTRRRGGLRFASAFGVACLAGAAHADSISLTAAGSAAPPSGEFAEAPLGDGAVPADVSSLLDPFPASLQQILDQPDRAEAAAQGASPAPMSTGPLGFLDANWQSPNLLGDMWGLRPALAKYGITLNAVENAETFGNLTGGVKQGFEVNGLTIVSLRVDAQKAFGLNGGAFNVSGLQIWGDDLSANNLLILQTLTGIEAPVGIRLWELWYLQKFGDKFDIKIGEQSIDQEFMISDSSSVFLNSVMGWPALPTVDLPAPGPTYPLAGLGVRGRAEVTDNVTVLAALLNGSPIPRNSPDTPASNPNGVSFPLNTDVLAIAELQFKLPGSTDSAKAKNESPLPGTYKIGAWYDSYGFADQQYDTIGLPLANPNSNGIPAIHHGDFSIYGVMDQTIWVSKDDSKISSSARCSRRSRTATSSPSPPTPA